MKVALAYFIRGHHCLADGSDISEGEAPKRARSGPAAPSRRSSAGRMASSGESSDAGTACKTAVLLKVKAVCPPSNQLLTILFARQSLLLCMTAGGPVICLQAEGLLGDIQCRCRAGMFHTSLGLQLLP